jgi:hypothetical protein
MSVWLRRGLIVIASLAALAAAAVALGLVLGERRMNRQIAVDVPAGDLSMPAACGWPGRRSHAAA